MRDYVLQFHEYYVNNTWDPNQAKVRPWLTTRVETEGGHLQFDREDQGAAAEGSNPEAEDQHSGCGEEVARRDRVRAAGEEATEPDEHGVRDGAGWRGAARSEAGEEEELAAVGEQEGAGAEAVLEVVAAEGAAFEQAGADQEDVLGQGGDEAEVLDVSI